MLSNYGYILLLVLMAITSDYIHSLMCMKDEAPHLVNPLVESFVARHATPAASVSTVV